VNTLDPSVNDAISLSQIANLPKPLQDRLLAGAFRIEVPAGGTIYREDDPPGCALVVDGLIRTYMTSTTGREVTVRYGRRGDLLGTTAIVGGPAPVSVQVVTEAALLCFNAGTVLEMTQAEPAFGWLVAEDIAQRMYETLEVLANQTFGSLRQRIARHLLDLAACQAHCGQLHAPVTQQALADAVGSVRPAVARVVAQLRSEGLIETTIGGVLVLDPAGLFEQSSSHVR
jgi:CRP/FNR family transcriptional regulator